jgi:hypothetical protein
VTVVSQFIYICACLVTTIVCLCQLHPGGVVVRVVLCKDVYILVGSKDHGFLI